MSQNTEGRSQRVDVLKKLIVVFLVLGILIPILLCILLFLKVENLQQQVNELRAEKAVERQMQVVTSVSAVAEHSGLTVAEEAEMITIQRVPAKRPENFAETQEEAVKDKVVTKVYLTFDDGPSSNTDEILDILKQYDVKATFFVTGRTKDEYLPIYKRIVEEGHTLGMHSFSHRYGEIYASEESFIADLEKLQEFLYDATGVWSRFYRFPGGSSNRVSDVSMNELAKYLTEQDIYYLDWNVSCGDASGSKLRPQKIADNVTENVKKYHTAVVLLHDAADKTTTVEALPLMIEKLQSMEHIEFVPVDDEMTPVRHVQQER